MFIYLIVDSNNEIISGYLKRKNAEKILLQIKNKNYKIIKVPVYDH